MDRYLWNYIHLKCIDEAVLATRVTVAHEMYGTGLASVSTATRTSTPTTNATPRVEPSAQSNPSSTHTAGAKSQNVAAADKKSQQQKKSAKAAPRESTVESLKTQRLANYVSSESSVTRPDRDVSAAVSKQRNDFTVDFRTPPQPRLPESRLPVAEVWQAHSEFGGRLSETSSLYGDQQSSSHIRAEEFLQVSNLSVCQ